MSHLLVTNDFPPKVGGIQVYLWELWRRLDPTTFTVLTASSHPDAPAFDRHCAEVGIRVERVPQHLLLPTPALARRVREVARQTGASLVVLDPALPLGVLGPSLGIPYAVVLHGAEVTVPGRLPLARGLLARTLRQSALLVTAGGYPRDEAIRAMGNVPPPPTAVVPPGVDLDRFRPLGAAERAEARARFGLPVDAPLVVGVSRLVPRKGFDVLIDAAVQLRPAFPDLTVVIAGRGRDEGRLAAKVDELGAPVRLVGPVPDDDLPALVGAADVFCVPCRNRWGGLEQEGFGIVFLEAAAAGVPQVAGASGGTPEAVVDGRTGLVVDHPRDSRLVAAALGRLLGDASLREALGASARARAEESFDYDRLAPRLAAALAAVGG